ncbi:hypothetical protein [Tenacibaculum finnmarkense]|uniref:hypothetical protein n=1 Tax=Tenacibaculum finnmarkense TaxID=2781243 RepID=UPI001EFA5628|nr:hypothetical protein [Tenacibaculum finnmarkense]MCG8796677.1 hypothetical protein [Tenacibaculum finnmarkense]MCG8799003.1 hypothetical protein [Tenacibaculum finnmarkense]
MKNKDNKFCIFKSIHFWSWLVFVLWAVFCYYYPREFCSYEDSIDKAFASLRFMFTWMIGTALWFLFYCFGCEILEK